MKKLFIVLALVLTIAPTNKANAASQKYTLYGIIYNAECVDCGNKFLAVITDDGNEWHLTSNRKYKDGQRVKLRMNTRETESIYDDVIIKIRKVK